jgi:hypothetical protein
MAALEKLSLTQMKEQRVARLQGSLSMTTFFPLLFLLVIQSMHIHDILPFVNAV